MCSGAYASITTAATNTSSSFFRSRAATAACRAEVPELQAIAYLVLNILQKFNSSKLTKSS